MIDLVRLSPEQWRNRRQYRFPRGANGAGWYWCFRATRGSCDEWWFGPHATSAEACRWGEVTVSVANGRPVPQ
jgi:hypothetical protein